MAFQKYYALSALLGLLLSCSNPTIGEWQKLRPDFAFGEKKSSELIESDQVIWKNRDDALTSKNKIDGFLVMVSTGSENHFSLANDPRSLLARTVSSSRGQVLMQLNDHSELSLLALQTHEQDHAPGCSKLVLLQNNSLSTLTAGSPEPVYDADIVLPKVLSLLSEPLESNLSSYISELESQGTRFHTTSSGAATPGLIETRIKALMGTGSENFEFKRYQHSATDQDSLIVTLPGTSSDAETIVFGAHLDSIFGSKFNLDQDAAPGADDDASGVAVLMEMLRIIAAEKLKFDHHLEFHFYGAEEIGLIGSGEIAGDYASQNKAVKAMFQLDMTSFSQDPNDTTIHLPDNATDAGLRRSVKQLLAAYQIADSADGTIKGGTSDHESWFLNGYPAVFPFEHPTQYNKSIHKLSDTSATINNIGLSKRFCQLGLVFAAHFAGLADDTTKSEFDAKKSDKQSKLGNDISLALQFDGTSKDWILSAAAPSAEAVAIEFCALKNQSEPICQHELINMTNKDERDGRRFFASALPSAPIEGGLVRLRSYDADEVMTNERIVSLVER